MPTQLKDLVAYSSILGLSIYIWKWLKARKTGPLPPGPKGLPILGNIFQLSLSMWTRAEEWKEEYGPIVYINVAGQGILLLNDHKVANDLLNRRASTYSERPRWIVASELLTGGLMLVFAKQTLIWRRMRRATHEALNRSATAKFEAILNKEATLLVHGLLKNPGDWDSEIRRYTASSVFSITYDAPTLQSPDDPSISGVNEFIDKLIHSAYPGSHLVEFFPWMLQIPRRFAKWKQDAEDGFQRYTQLFEGMFHDVEQRMDDRDDRPSFAATLIKERTRHGLNDRESAWRCATIFAAGAETTSSVLSWFILAMTTYPEAQKRCQEEIDSVVGQSRLPTLQDRANLPYIEATVREALRWRAVLPLGIHHYAAQDDYYEGYFIPKGTICLANLWAINRDREVFGLDADDFNPSRFIENPSLAKENKDEGKIDKYYHPHVTHDASLLLGHWSYGFGHRTCVGRHVANNSLFLAITRLLWAATIAPEDNALIPDTLDTVTGGMVLRPKPFSCKITYRFSEAEDILKYAKDSE